MRKYKEEYDKQVENSEKGVISFLLDNEGDNAKKACFRV